MIGFIFIGIPIICIIALIIMGCSGAGSSKGRGTYVFIHDEDGEIVDDYLDRSGRYDDEDEFPGGIRIVRARRFQPHLSPPKKAKFRFK